MNSENSQCSYIFIITRSIIFKRYNLKRTSCKRWFELYNADLSIPDTFSRSSLDEESTGLILQKIAYLKTIQSLLKSITGEKSIRAPVPIKNIGALIVTGVKETQNRRKAKSSKVTVSERASRRFKAKNHRK